MYHLIVLSRNDQKQADLCTRACVATHTTMITGVKSRAIYSYSGPGTLHKAIVSATSLRSGRYFIVTTTDTFITKRHDIKVPVKLVRRAKRSLDDTNRMIRTMRYLLTNGYDAHDYELNVPLLIDKKVLDKMPAGNDYFFRTMYCNMHCGMNEVTPVGMEDPRIDRWLHSMDPDGPIVSLGPTSLRHSMCVRWIRKLYKQCRSSGRPVLVQ